MSAVLGASIPFHRHMPAGLIPAALADELKDFAIEGKDGLIVLNDRPVNAETPAHLLDDPVTPTARHSIRNNGNLPEEVDPATWKLIIDGEVDDPLELTIDDLKGRFEVVTLQLQLECAGNGRAGFNPPASGNQWTVGAVAAPNGPGSVSPTCCRRPASGRRRSTPATTAPTPTSREIPTRCRSRAAHRSRRRWIPIT
jgi:hypothetical protein